MIISVVTLFPELYQPFLQTSLMRRAQEQKLLSVDVHNMFTDAQPKERIDSPTFGHGAGLLIKPDIVEKAITEQETKYGKAYKIFFSPQGKKLDQVLLRSLAQQAQAAGHIMLLPARYEGMDARVEEHYADCIISVGDFVLMAGDLPAMVLMEGLSRLIPGVVGKQESIEHESFSGPFVDYPEYTDPVEWKGLRVPDIVRSGNHKELLKWRKDVAAKKSVLHHFDWVRSHVNTQEDIQQAQQYIPAHYAVLMHSNILLEEGREGTSSVTSLDIHDIARSARTFGIKNYFIVTPLQDQQKIINKLLEFWRTDVGIEYNRSRHEALDTVILMSSLDQVLADIEQKEKAQAVLVATAARSHQGVNYITYNDQEAVWALGRPVLFVFGTARGLAPSVVNRCEFMLEPITGFSSFNHLSVRSAAAIVFDRWLGINKASTAKIHC